MIADYLPSTISEKLLIFLRLPSLETMNAKKRKKVGLDTEEVKKIKMEHSEKEIAEAKIKAGSKNEKVSLFFEYIYVDCIKIYAIELTRSRLVYNTVPIGYDTLNFDISFLFHQNELKCWVIIPVRSMILFDFVYQI